ncbi:amidohydrolase family protein [Phytoactinopolyspora halophila]|uniref:amidohydrolase family protein n=1 Tax=Phytoactinopolyspora halophila TaxID=1981511 RepID=UPI001B8BB26C|nr:amidohydrolase family protein [Phytoactinopolyspora halophila]
MTGRVDAHHHLWDPQRRDYPWMTGPAAPLRRHYGLEDLRAVTPDAGIDRTVIVQAAHDASETEDLLDIAASSGGLVAGVVGWVDLTANDLTDQLDRLRARPGGDRLVGVRHQVHDEADPEWLLRPEVGRGLRVLARQGLVYDLLVRVRELPAACRVAREIDDLSFVLDHGAKPPIADGGTEPWAGLVSDLAALPNVSCKVSGLVTEAQWDRWTVDDLRPYTDRLLEWFGPPRLLAGSDWPVCTLAASYAEVFAAARACLSDLSDAESAAVFGGTASRVYSL